VWAVGACILLVWYAVEDGAFALALLYSFIFLVVIVLVFSFTPLVFLLGAGWVRDDVPSIDIGGLVVGDQLEEAYLLGKSKGILAGVPFFNGAIQCRYHFLRVCSRFF